MYLRLCSRFIQLLNREHASIIFSLPQKKLHRNYLNLSYQRWNTMTRSSSSNELKIDSTWGTQGRTGGSTNGRRRILPAVSDLTRKREIQDPFIYQQFIFQNLALQLRTSSTSICIRYLNTRSSTSVSRSQSAVQSTTSCPVSNLR